MRQQETQRWGFVLAAVFCRHLYVHNVAVHNIIVINVVFFKSITLFHHEADKGALLCEREIKSCIESEIKAIFKVIAHLFCFSFNTFFSCLVFNNITNVLF